MSRNQLIGLALAATVVTACNGHPVDKLDNVVTAVSRQENRLPAKTKLDFLFVVDNSGSMCQEQDNLTKNFRAFSEFLFQELGAAADYRIAVTSTDLQSEGHKGAFLASPAAPEPSLNCKDQFDQPLVPQTADCPANLPKVLTSGRDGNIVDQDDLELKFRCLATLGTAGDGFEKGLEAMRLSLSCKGPNKGLFEGCCLDDGTYDPACVIREDQAEPTFLRPDAVLVVIFISDENDCSDPATNPADSRRVICKYGSGDGDGDQIPDGYRDRDLCGDRSPADCFRAECGDLDAESCRVERCVISRAANSNCEWFRGNLTPVEDYYRFLTGLKAQPLESLVVAAIVGRRAFTEAGNEITYNPGNPDNAACNPDDPSFDPALKDTETCCPNGSCRGEIQTSCASTNGEAFSGRRYLKLAEQFEDRGIGCPIDVDQDDPTKCVNICVDDFSEPLERIKDQVAKILATYCLDKPPACQVPATADAPARSCETDEERANTANYAIRVRKQCQRSIEEGGKCEVVEPPQLLPRDAYELILGDPGCTSGAIVRLDDPPPAGAEVFVEFLVALDQASGGGSPADAGNADAQQ